MKSSVWSKESWANAAIDRFRAHALIRAFSVSALGVISYVLLLRLIGLTSWKSKLLMFLEPWELPLLPGLCLSEVVFPVMDIFEPGNSLKYWVSVLLNVTFYTALIHPFIRSHRRIS